MNYVIYTDASADVDKEFLKKSGVKFVQMRYTVGDEERLCDSIEEEAFLKKFYDAQREGKTTQTSQITPNTYMEEFEPLLKEGISVLYLSLSSGLTKTYDSVCLAARELAETYTQAKVVPVDTLSATGGMGLLVEKAAENREKGMSIEENAAWLEANRLNVELWFMVDDLMYLKRGGRIPAATAVIGTALNIKPILEVDSEGKLITVEKKRGIKTALKALASRYESSSKAEISSRVYIVHGDCSDRADELESMIREINPNADITKMMLCPVIGAHTGPGMAAVIYWGAR
jgi:DegV family protein with EDD domain